MSDPNNTADTAEVSQPQPEIKNVGHFPAATTAAGGAVSLGNAQQSGTIGAQSPDGLVTYFLLDPASDRIKIGRSKKLKQRLRNLGSAAGLELRLIGTLPGDQEHEWHRRYRDARLRGEWFKLTPALAQSLRDLFGVRIRHGTERAPRPKSGVADVATDLETKSGLGLRSPDRDDLEEYLLTILPQFWPSGHDDDEGQDENEPVAEDDEEEERSDDFWRAAGPILSVIDRWDDHWFGWMAPPDVAPPDVWSEVWLDLWLCFWRPLGEETTKRLRSSLLVAAVESEASYQGEPLRLRPLLVDKRGACAIEELPPDELYSDEMLYYVVNGFIQG
jgi:hypothetical protein